MRSKKNASILSISKDLSREHRIITEKQQGRVVSGFFHVNVPDVLLRMSKAM